jgi:hypothetical protein
MKTPLPTVASARGTAQINKKATKPFPSARAIPPPVSRSAPPLRPPLAVASQAPRLAQIGDRFDEGEGVIIED